MASDQGKLCPEWEETRKEDFRGVWVVGEVYRERIAEASLQMLTPARQVAEKLGVDVAGVVLGHRVRECAQEMIYHGADRLILVDHPSLETYFPEVYAATVAQLAKASRPELILMAGTMRGRETAPYLANLLRTGITADCTGFDVDPESRDVLQIRPPFGALMLASIKTPHRRPQIATARPNIFPLPERDEGRRGEVAEVAVEVPKPRGRLIGARPMERRALLLEKAEYVVSGGKGIGGPEGFGLLEELASLMGGLVAGSRKAVDAGWVTPDRQVGQTGKAVRPVLYVAVGISGAAQHVFGIREAGRVVAINTDPEAPIFRHADYGVVADYRQILPLLIEEIRRVKRSLT